MSDSPRLRPRDSAVRMAGVLLLATAIATVVAVVGRVAAGADQDTFERSMLSDRLQDAINRQINNELFSAHLYLSMSAYFESLDLNGFAHWMKLQFEEETAHALKLFDYVNDRDGRVVLQAIEQPQVEFESPHSVMRRALEHERLVTSMINDLYALAISERDYPTHVLLEWFVSEQVEEEKVLNEIVTHMDLIGDDGTGLIIMDQRLGSRTAEAGADAESGAADAL